MAQESVTDFVSEVVVYYRVSTGKQGKSGLGLEAQRQKVAYCVQARNLFVVAEFTGVESGRKKCRNALEQALALCRERNATLLIADLSRLARSVFFITQLEESGIMFRSVDHFDAGKLVVHIIASVDQDESERVSKRTIAALQVAKQRGVQLGRFGKQVLSQRNRCQAQAFAQSMKAVIAALKSEGFKTVRAIRDELNKRQIAPYSGQESSWHIGTVFNLLHRIEGLSG